MATSSSRPARRRARATCELLLRGSDTWTGRLSAARSTLLTGAFDVDGSADR